MEKKITLTLTMSEADQLADNLNVAVKTRGICPQSVFAFNLVERLRQEFNAPALVPPPDVSGPEGDTRA